MADFVGGWAREKEDWDVVNAMFVADDALSRLVGSYSEVTIDPRKVLITEQQGPVGSCRGHSGSTLGEWIWLIATGKVPAVRLSPACFYYETQRIDGIRGDRGSTIMGGVKLLREFGCCEFDLWPYDRRYNPSRPTNWEAITYNAANYKVTKSMRLKSYDAVRTFLGSGQGGVDCGISWSSSYAQPVVERFRGGSGGHAIALPALSDRLDSTGRPYVWMLNSHGMGSGVKGWSEWSPTFVDGAISDRSSVFVGLSDMPNIKPREITLDELKRKLRA